MKPWQRPSLRLPDPRAHARDQPVDKNATFPEWAERDDVLRDIRKDTIKLLLADDATKPLVSTGFIDEILQVATAREGAAA
jgi:hypothetical protein